MRLTRRGVAVLAGAVCCYAFGVTAGYPFFLVLAGGAVGSVLAAAVTTTVRPKVEISRTVHPDRVERGKPALASLVVRNTTARRQPGFTAGDRVGVDVRTVGVRPFGSGVDVRTVRVRPLAPGAEATYHYELPTSVRGRLRVGPFAVHRFDPFDLVRGHPTVGDSRSLWVHPRTHPARLAQVGHPRHHYDGPLSDPPLHGSSDLRAVREYVIGDEVRHLHWKATAKTGRLMVREYVDPARTRCAVVLDTRRSAMGPAVFEEAVEVAASLVYASASAGQQLRLITPGGDTPVDGGLRAARPLLDELCLIGQDAADDVPLTPKSVTARPGGALVVITGPVADLGAVGGWRPDAVIRLGGTGPSSAGLIVAADAVEAVARWNALRDGRS
ncbi:DUF58 domain-containing protein [Actinosynnema sp. CS-041913]|uniref:DUF58 domain-containing protein n=1 Tax=Actinosynnema sp. CS-041913 TaxID=3239917 RepID=UPI003D8DD48A